MITTITLNPAIDKTITVEHFKLNSVNRVKSVHEDIGGKGINVSKVLTCLNSKNTAIGFIGERNYGVVQSLIKKENLATDFILVDAYTRINTKIVDPINVSTTDINELGFTVQTMQIEQLKVMVRSYSKLSDFVVFSGSVCQGISNEDFKEMLDLAKPSKVVLDADRDIFRIGLTSSPYLIKPNIHELEDYLNFKLDTMSDIVNASRRLIKEFDITYILVSLGEKGSVLISKDYSIHASALDIDVVSTVGAGDSMLAGFIYAITQNMTIEDSLKYANCCGGLAVSEVSLNALKSKNIMNELKNIRIEYI